MPGERLVNAWSTRSPAGPPVGMLPPVRAALRVAAWWMPTASMTLLSLLSYVDRNVLALLSKMILDDTGLNAESYGLMISAFSVAYLVGNPMWGRALDRFGVRSGLALAVAIWTCASV